MIRDINDQLWRVQLLVRVSREDLDQLVRVKVIPLTPTPTPGSQWDGSPLARRTRSLKLPTEVGKTHTFRLVARPVHREESRRRRGPVRPAVSPRFANPRNLPWQALLSDEGVERVEGEVSEAVSRPHRRAAGELEAEVLGALWAAHEALTPGRVRRALDGALAYNTVQTILARLFDKGLVDRVPDGRRHAYFPVKGEEDLAVERMQALLGHGSDRRAVLQRFASSLTSEDARALRAMLDKRRRKR